MNYRAEEIYWIFIALVVTAFSLFFIFVAGEETPAVEVVEVVEVVEEVVFNVDGVTCWAGNFPTMVYDPADSTVKLTITCSDEVVWHYLPAIERTQ